MARAPGGLGTGICAGCVGDRQVCPGVGPGVSGLWFPVQQLEIILLLIPVCVCARARACLCFCLFDVFNVC